MKKVTSPATPAKTRTAISLSYFDRSTLRVARDLLGTILVRKIGGHTHRLMITDVEAYDGPNDLASHASKMRASKGLTLRTSIMFGPPGYWYVYFVYGMHYMLNIVVAKKGYPAAILIRGVHDLENNTEIHGPARLTRLLHITKKENGLPALPPTKVSKSRLWIEYPTPAENSHTKKTRKVIRAPRIGVDYAGDIWAAKKYRFILKQKTVTNLFVRGRGIAPPRP